MAEYVLETLTDVEHHVKLLGAATRADEIVRAAGHYLASWSSSRIEELQKIDGGWGPFDSQRRPDRIHDVADIARISDVLGRHCRALRNAGIEPTPELLELDLYFTLARQVAANFINLKPGTDKMSRRRVDQRRWHDRGAKAA